MINSDEKRRTYKTEWQKKDRENNPEKYNKAWRKYRGSEKWRDTQLRYTYGIGAAEYDALPAKQHGFCALCESVTDLCVDHDHVTGKVRGILCRTCNVGLGMLGDNKAGLLRALAYLEAASE